MIVDIHGYLNVALSEIKIQSDHIIKSPQSGVTLCFQFISVASAAASVAAATTFASHV